MICLVYVRLTIIPTLLEKYKPEKSQVILHLSPTCACYSILVFIPTYYMNNIVVSVCVCMYSYWLYTVGHSAGLGIGIGTN